MDSKEVENNRGFTNRFFKKKNRIPPSSFKKPTIKKL